MSQRIWVTLDGLAAIEGTVSWCNKGEAGIRFVSALHQAVLDHLVGTHGFRSGNCNTFGDRLSRL